MKERDYKITVARMGENWSWFPWQQKSYVGEIGAHKKKSMYATLKGEKCQANERLTFSQRAGCLGDPCRLGVSKETLLTRSPSRPFCPLQMSWWLRSLNALWPGFPIRPLDCFVVVVFVDATDASVFLCSVSESPLGERLSVEVVRQQCHKYF